MPPVALSDLELSQIERYRVTLLATTICGGAGQGPSGDGSRGTRKTGEGGSGRGSRLVSRLGGRNWGTVKGFGKKKKNGTGQQEEFKTHSLLSDALPVLEDVDEGAHVTYPTYKDDLMLMASYGDDTGVWKEELAKFLQAEREEQEKVKTERMARVRDWLTTT
jgi:hypothetical protein